MVDTANRRESVLEVARLIKDHRGEDTVILYLGELEIWTDYFIITTVRSSAHMLGLMRELHRHLSEKNITALNSHKRITDKGWHLIDCGDFVIHLMEREQREFYELERLWFKAEPLDF